MQIHIYLEGRAAPVTSTELPDDLDALARGRNGWFRPRQIMIWWQSGRICIAIYSRRISENAPIQLQIAPPVARALVTALLGAVAETEN